MIMMKKTVNRWILFAVMMTTVSGYAQEVASVAGKTEIIQDQRIDLLVWKHIRINEALKTIEGFRIQVFSDSGNNSKSNAQNLRDDLTTRYPGLGVYLSFKSPNYKVRVGDFRTRLDAQRFLSEISIDFPNAFIVTDQIQLPDSN